jgi:hypothetical protein
MLEPGSLPGTSGLLPTSDPSGLQRRLTAILHASPAPTLCVCRDRDSRGDLVVAGATLFQQVRQRVTSLRRAGIRTRDVLASDAIGAARVIDALAAALGGFVFWPTADLTALSDSNAPLVWRVSHAQASAGETPQTVAVPMRITAPLRARMAIAGTHVRLLAASGDDSGLVAVNAQTIARIGTTIGRRLGLQRRSVRYCAAPPESIAGVVLDLLPGIAARQIMVLPEEPSPSLATITHAIGRYRPDALTLTREQAAHILDGALDADLLAGLRGARVLLCDSRPIPVDLRRELASRVARLDVAYILPEAGDVVIL